MLAKAESGNTVFPPAEGFERLGSRVPSAGTGMGTWSLLVRARKQAPDLLLALGQLSWVKPRPCLSFDCLHTTQVPQKAKYQVCKTGER